eukprot:SAG11_NODE_27546_length_331_cov_1.103448_1_plen_57_part_10
MRFFHRLFMGIGNMRFQRKYAPHMPSWCPTAAGASEGVIYEIWDDRPQVPHLARHCG